jgi:uroporphyrinogen decarboxylase
MMLPRERVIAQLNHRESDIVPMGENHIHHSLVEKFLKREVMYGNGFAELKACWEKRRDEYIRDSIATLTELPLMLGHDYIRVPASPVDREYRQPKMLEEYSWEDETGRVYHYNPEIGQQVTPIYNTEMTIDDLPDVNEEFKVDESEMEVIKGVIAKMKPTHFIIARLPLDGTFAYKQTVGIEEYMVRMILDPDFIKKASEIYVNRSIAYINAFLDAGADAVMPTDDYADNRGIMMGHERFTEFILPGIKKQVKATHAKGGYFIKHTDGRTWDILPDLVAAGADGWHGIQPSIGMDFKILKEKFGRDLCFFGGVNVETLIQGTPEDIEEEVRYAIEHAAPGGGLVLASGNGLENGTTPEQYQAMIDARNKYGRYGK